MPRPRPGVRLAAGIAIGLGALAGMRAPVGLAQDGQDLERRAGEIAEAMTAAERVGQLVLVPFAGPGAGDDDAIARLIVEDHVGGVILDPGSGNFGTGPDAGAQVATLSNALQTRYAQSHETFVPLFVSLAASRESLAGIPIADGLPQLPSLLAIGATWDTTAAERSGEVAGAGLAAMGVNLLMGPDLDVHPGPRPAGTGDLGTASFGGSPAWVGQLGRAFIRGVHLGSAGRMVTSVGSFPGIGGADRGLEEAIAVVERPFEQLLVSDLAPFLAVTDAGEGDGEALTDALRSSQVRYRGIQSQTERPFALDGGGLRYLDGQIPSLAAWRAAGGLRLSPGLGLPAFRAYAAAGGSPDPVAGPGSSTRRVLREALVAGHDILDLSGLDSAGGAGVGPTQGADEIRSSVRWLVSQYETDAELRGRMDESLRQVLRAKLDLYGGPSRAEDGPGVTLSSIVADPEPLRDAAPTTEVVDQVARAGLTRVSPADGAQLGSPQPGELILWVVDARASRDCAECPARLIPDPAWFTQTTRLAYGPEGSGLARLARPEDVDAITFRDLKLWLQDRREMRLEDTPALETRQPDDRPFRETDALLRDADWLVFAMRDLGSAAAPASDALRLFLKARPSAPEGQRRWAFAMGAPYHLDTTEIAGLTAYFGLYSPTRPFAQVAVRALYGDVAAEGDSPVFIPGAGYDLAQRLQPDPQQRVQLEPMGWTWEDGVAMGNSFRIRTSPIIDRNGNAVPDGTRITFRRFVPQDNAFLQDVTVETGGGRALAGIRAEREGVLELTVVQDNVVLSQPMELVVKPGSILAPVWPTGGIDRPRYVDWGIFLLSLSLILLGGVLVYGADPLAGQAPSRLVRLFLLSLAWGLAGYLLVAAGGVTVDLLPGGQKLWPQDWRKAYQAPILSFLFAIMPVIPTLVRSLRGGPRA